LNLQELILRIQCLNERRFVEHRPSLTQRNGETEGIHSEYQLQTAVEQFISQLQALLVGGYTVQQIDQCFERNLSKLEEQSNSGILLPKKRKCRTCGKNLTSYVKQQITIFGS
jgi:hypothetical protein